MRADRLLRLAEHLEGGKLGHIRFNYAITHSYCGIVGCAMGELPYIWPDEFKFLDGYMSVFNKKRLDLNFVEAQCEFFGISDYERNYLFFPMMNGNTLRGSASKEEVAAHIRSFVASKLGPARLTTPEVKEEPVQVSLAPR